MTPSSGAGGAFLLCSFLLGCHPPSTAAVPASDTTIRFRPGDALPALGPEARVDRGLRAAAEALAAAATTPDSRLNPVAVRAALGLGHYPGPAHFVRVVGGATLPAALVDGIPHDQPVDIGYAWRDFADGRRWWVLGWSLRPLDLDPMPATVALGRTVSVRVTGGAHPRLFLGSPTGKVSEFMLNPGDARVVSGLDEAGTWRFEVVDGDKVELLFGLTVGAGQPELPVLATSSPVEDPRTVVAGLYARVDALRKVNGRAPLVRFERFEPLVREQAACLAAGGLAAHDTEHCPGVPGRATQQFYPRGHYYEDVAVAESAAEAWDTLVASPGHLANLLAPDCTHVSIGAALEPVNEPRLFVVFEAMHFPDGEPRRIGDR